MKKLFISMLAAVTLLASCSEDDIVSKTNGESMISFTVSTPELSSRALGDGTTATKLYYAVYDENDGTATIVESVSKNGTDAADVAALDKKKATIDLPLLNGHTYSILFWAESGNCSYDIDWVTKTISLAAAANDVYSINANNENEDAFYAYVKPFVVTGDKVESVKLYRPFAQLNIGTTEDDIARVNEYFPATGTTSGLTQTSVVLKSVPTKMDLATGTASEAKDVTYKLAAFEDLNDAEDGNVFPAEGYQYISMNYILVGTEKGLYDLEMTTDVEGLETRTYKNVPLQANYRTNIYGVLFTSATEWNVEIEDPFYTPDYEVMDGVLELTDDMILSNNIYVENNLAINLNGRTLTYKGEDPIMARVENGATLTFNGPGKVISDGYMASANQGGTIYINGGSFESKSATCFQANGGEIYISGGYFQVEKASGTNDYRYTLNHIDSKKDEGKIVVTGGTFYQYNPAESDSENPQMNFVPEGYVSENIGTDAEPVYEVYLNPATSIVNGNLVLTDNASVKKTLKVSTLNGNGNTLNISENVATNYIVQSETAANIQNLNIVGNGQKWNDNGTIRSTRALYFTGEGNVDITNVNVSGVGYALNVNSAKKGENILNVSNSTLEGWTSFSSFKTATFSNVTFKKGSYFTDGTTNGMFRPYSDVTLRNCSFEKGFTLSLTENVIINIEDCTVDGTAVTSDNVATLLNIEHKIGTLQFSSEVKTTTELVNGTFNGEGKTIVIGENLNINHIVKGIGDATIKNLNIVGDNQMGINAAGEEASTRALYFEGSGNVTVENVYVAGVGYAFNAGGSYTNNTLTVKNSTLIGWTSFNPFQSATFTNVHFGISEYFGENNMFNGGFRPYSNVTLENCTFEKGFYLSLTERATITLKNCKVLGAGQGGSDLLITTENYQTSASLNFENGNGSISVVNQ